MNDPWYTDPATIFGTIAATIIYALLIWGIYKAIMIFKKAIRFYRGTAIDYDQQKALAVTLENLDGDTAIGLDQKDVEAILNSLYEWEDKMSVGGGQIPSNIFVNKYPEPGDYIAERHKIYKRKDIENVLAAQVKYLKQIGLAK